MIISHKLKDLSLLLHLSSMGMTLAVSALKEDHTPEVKGQILDMLSTKANQLNELADMVHLLSHVEEVSFDGICGWADVLVKAAANGFSVDPMELAVAQAIQSVLKTKGH